MNASRTILLSPRHRTMCTLLLSDSTFTLTLRGGCHHQHPHFTDENNEDSERTCAVSWIIQLVNDVAGLNLELLDFKAYSFDQEPILFTRNQA